MLRSKFVLGLAVAGLASTAIASNSGFYVGSGLGRSTNESASTMRYNNADFSSDRNQARSGMDYGLVAGYQYTVNEMFGLGLEAGYDFGKTKSVAGTMQDEDGTMNSSVLTSKNSTMLSLKPTYNLAKGTDLFARVGGVQTAFEYSPSQLNGQDSDGLYKKNRYGAVAGLGFETAIADNLSLTGEYDHIAYRNWTVEDLNANNTTTLKNSTDKFKIGVAYYFD